MHPTVHLLVLADSGFGALSSGLGINALAFLSQLVSFGIVFLILRSYAFPVIIRLLNEREARIREGIENAEKAKSDLANANKQVEQLLIKARQDAQATIERAEKTAQQEAARIIEDAHTRAQKIGEQQTARIQQEASRARNELSRLVVDLSINAAGQVIERSVNNNDNRRLVQEFVSASSTDSRQQ